MIFCYIHLIDAIYNPDALTPPGHEQARVVAGYDILSATVRFRSA